MWDPAYDQRPWEWFERNVMGLLTRTVAYAPSGAPVFQTRLAWHFYQAQAFEAHKKAIDEARAK